MSRIAWMVCALAALVAAPAPAEERKPADAKPAATADAAERVLDALARPVALPDGTAVNDKPLSELLRALGKAHGVKFVLNQESFADVGAANVRDEKPNVATADLGGLTLHQFLGAALGGLGATYLVRNGSIEVVSVGHAAKVTKAKAGPTEGQGGRTYLEEPLVSAIVKDKPLNEAVAKIAEMYDLSVTVGPQAADAKAGFVTARLLNVPADQALELLALQCDLRVVRRGAAFYITSKDHANELFNEKLDRRRQQIELKRLKDAPVLPLPPAPPAP